MNKDVVFSRKTVVKAAKSLATTNSYYHSDFSSFLREIGPPVSRIVRGESVSLAKRINDLIDFYNDNPTFVLDDNRTLQIAIVEEAAWRIPPDRDQFPDGLNHVPILSEPTDVQEEFLTLLAADGFTVSGCKLQPTMPEELGLVAGKSEIEALLERHKMHVALGHLEQVLDNFGRGKWSAANGQLRNLVDSVFDEICIQLEPSSAAMTTANRRDHLAMRGFFSEDLNEWGNNGKNFVNGMITRLNPQGPHPGLSDADDATFRLHIVLVSIRMFLKRFDHMRQTP